MDSFFLLAFALLLAVFTAWMGVWSTLYKELKIIRRTIHKQ